MSDLQNLNSGGLSRTRVELLASMIGESEPMLALKEEIIRVALIDGTVLIYGPTGVGKELLAKLVHGLSHRAEKPMVTVDCTTLPSELAESELFGYVRGAFTGAFRAKMGLFEAAQGGTVFLDEVDDLQIAIQSRLLRALESRTVRRIGSTTEIALNVRVIAASKVDLRKAIRQKRFREDLFYRLAEFPIRVPSLRERNGDIRLLAIYFLKANGGQAISEDAFEALEEHDWPGNIRELRNVIVRAANLSSDGLVGPSAVTAALEALKMDYDASPPSMPATSAAGATEVAAAAAATDATCQPVLDIAVQDANAGKELRTILAETERRVIETVLKDCRFNKAKAARRLGLSYKGLLSAMRRLGLDQEAKTCDTGMVRAEPAIDKETLIRLLDQLGSVPQVATKLGGTENTIYNLVHRFGLADKYIRESQRRHLSPSSAAEE